MITILSSKTDLIGGYDYTVRLGEYLRQKSASSSGSLRAFWKEYSNWEAVKIALSSSSADNYFWLGSEEFATEPDFEISREVIGCLQQRVQSAFEQYSRIEIS